jgi:hypothetical protein
MTDPLSASRKFEEEARRWKETGETGWSGLNEYGYTKLRFWLSSQGAFDDRISDLLWEYGETVEQVFIDGKQPGWFSAFMRTRDSCSICGETFMLGNLGFCTQCECLLGYCHRFSGGRTANGNPKCPACGAGEIVGDEYTRPSVEFKVHELKPGDLLKGKR